MLNFGFKKEHEVLSRLITVSDGKFHLVHRALVTLQRRGPLRIDEVEREVRRLKRAERFCEFKDEAKKIFARRPK